MPTEEEKYLGMMEIYDCDLAEAKIRVEMYEHGMQAGIAKGQAEAQRFFQLALGVTEPTSTERAMWNNPVPLKEKVQ